MAINISIIESSKQIVFGIPEYISITVDQPCNVFYTFDGTAPDPTGASLDTFILETDPENPLQGFIFLPRDTNFLSFNILAVGIPSTNIGTFYRRYGLESRLIGIGRPGIKKPVLGGSGYTNTSSPNRTSTGEIIAPDGYTEGSSVIVDITDDGYDGYVDKYSIAISGQQTAIPPNIFDHIDGYDGNSSVVATTTLTPEQEEGLLKLSNRGYIFINDGHGLVSNETLRNIDPRSSTVIDSDNDQIEIIPVETDPELGNFEDNAPQPVASFTSGGIFDPHALFIEIDGRVDGYINGQQINPGDRTIINKPYGQLRLVEKREDLGDALRTSLGYISGGLVCPIYDYNKGQAAFYYWDNHDYRWVVSLQKITPPNYEIFAKRNGVVIAQVFRWINGRRVMLPG